MSVDLNISETDYESIKQYAAALGLSISDCLVKAARELAEDAYDLECYKAAKAEYDADSATVSHEELMKKYGLSEE